MRCSPSRRLRWWRRPSAGSSRLDHYFKTRAEMGALFADLPEALDNTVEIARRVTYRPMTRNPVLPKFAAAPDLADADAIAAEAGRWPRWRGPGSRSASRRAAWREGKTAEEYRERLEFELGIIEKMKYPGYFLIVADFIQWAKAQGIPVGPGRGSGAGSLVAYCDHHHRSRSAALQSAVRALPQSRARLDAGLRHRFLPGPARRGDPLRPAQIRHRAGGADHHLRNAAGARRAARRRPRAADALWPGRPHLPSWCRPIRPIPGRSSAR